ncbi:ankyrin repeat-containing domain protein [Neurospora tetraspora]|uniref:Ankyrin repeat-containing domain protein n=1 Tax=Neurospora tetraspora TaxID=94610 RepID=A0AAE0JHR8_9PEZI|nr:ankyrin repeat-containing domain protein [Neurospora tetraspora]
MASSLFLRLPQELHVLIGDNLKQDGSLNALAALSRTSRCLRSSYEPTLYQGLVPESDDNDNPACQHALIWGARHNSIPVMAQAKAYGADLDKQVKYAIGRVDWVTWSGPYNPNAPPPIVYAWGSALQLAVHDGHDDAVQWLLDQGAELDDVDNPSVDVCRCCERHGAPTGNRSILHLATCAGHVSTLRALLERGASLDVAEEIDREHALHATLSTELGNSRNNKFEPLAILTALLDHLALGITAESAKSAALNSVNKGGLTLLQMAIEYNHIPVMEQALHALVGAGASLGPLPPTAQGTEGGRRCMTPLLHTLLEDRGFETIHQLLDLGADINGDRPDPVQTQPQWQSPLHFLVRHLDQGAIKPGAPLYRGDLSLLYESEDQGRWHRGDVVDLLRRGASLDIQDAQGRTPLGSAMSYGGGHLSLHRRLGALKMVKVMLKNVVPGQPGSEGGVSEESITKAKEWMGATVVERARGPEHDVSSGA